MSKDNRLHTGKEFDSMHGLNLYDNQARMYDPIYGKFTGIDPLAEDYYGISPYVHCGNNPIKFIDRNGMEIDLSGMSETERKRYLLQINQQQQNSQLFAAMYLSLETSKNVYSINFGQTISNNDGNTVEGQFMPLKNGGGSITFSENQESIKIGTLTEELFHAYQNDNKSNYNNGEFNLEFEAKVAVTAIGSEGGCGYGEFGGMVDFQTKVGIGDYGKGNMQITPQNATSNIFLNDYNKAANKYSIYNKNNNIGNSNYRKMTTVNPYSLQYMIKKAYGK